MAIKRDELSDPNSCFNRAAADEPIFVLRAKDPLAAKLVEEWAARALLENLHEDDKIRAAFRFAQAMKAWRAGLPAHGADPAFPLPPQR